MVCLRIPTVRFQQESLSALNRPGCPFSARILVLFQQELMSALLRNCCPLSARTGVRFAQDFAIDEGFFSTEIDQDEKNKPLKRGRGSQKKSKVLVMAESIPVKGE